MRKLGAVTAKEHTIKHKHCVRCGSCINSSTIHSCVAVIDPSIAEVMRMDMNPKETGYLRAIPYGFQLATHANS